MLQKLEKIIGNLCVNRINTINFNYRRKFNYRKIKNFNYFIDYPIKILFLVSAVASGWSFVWVIIVIAIIELLPRSYELFCYKYIVNMIESHVSVTKKCRLLYCIDYDLLNNLFERPKLELFNSLFSGIFFTGIVVSGILGTEKEFYIKFIFATVLVIQFVRVLFIKNKLKDLLIKYFEKDFKEDYISIWNCEM